MSRYDDGTSGPARSLSDCVWGETPRDRRNMKRFVIMCLIWLLVYVGVDMVQEKTTISSGLAWALSPLPALPAAALFVIYARFLKETDEMVRRVHMNGLAVGFAAGAFLVIGMQAPGLVGDRIFDKEVVFTIMTLGWVAGQLWGAWRYR